MTLRQDLHATINRSRSQQDRDVAIEELELAIERITTAVGFDEPKNLPKPDKGATADELLTEARTCIRNDDLTGTRVRLLQAIKLGGGSPPPAPKVTKERGIHDMTKAELVAYAAAQDPPIEITVGGTKTAIVGQIQEEHDARNADEEKGIHEMTKAELIAYAAAEDPPIEINGKGTNAAIIGQIQEELDARNAVV